MKHTCLFSFFIFYVHFLSAQRNTLTTGQLTGQLNVFGTAVPFLLLTPDARAGALGETGAATSPDAFSNYWNAAKIPFAKDKMGFGISYTPWLRALTPNIDLAYLSGYRIINSKSAFSASLRYIGYGNLTFTNITGNVSGQFRPNEFAADVSYAYKLNPKWSAAFTLRYIHSDLTNGQNIGGSSSHTGIAVAGDIAFFHFSHSTLREKILDHSFGINISNIGRKMVYTNNGPKEFLPCNLKFGGNFMLHCNENNLLGISCDLNKLLVPYRQINYAGSVQYAQMSALSGMLNSFQDPAGFRGTVKEFTIGGGLEYCYRSSWILRGGFFYEEPTSGNRQYFTIGFGIIYSAFHLDFSYLKSTNMWSPLQNTFRFSLAFHMAGIEKRKDERGNDYK